MSQTQKDIVRVACSLTAYLTIAAGVLAVGWFTLAGAVILAQSVGY